MTGCITYIMDLFSMMYFSYEVTKDSPEHFQSWKQILRYCYLF